MSKLLFNPEEKKEIITAIGKAESNTSGEIKLHVERKCKGDVLARAVSVFKVLKMHKTELHNGVLFYLAVDDKKFAIIGDSGIDKVVPDNFWNDVKEEVIAHFKDQNLAHGLTQGILMAGEKLKEFFPHQADDVNELSDDISINNN